MVTKESIKLPHKKGKTPSIDFHYSELLGRIQKITHTRTQAGLAAILNVSQSSVAEAKRRQSIPADWYLKLFEKLGVNPDWLKKGSGPVYLRTEAGYVPSDGDGPPIDPGLLGSPLAQSALAPVYAMCGDSTKTGSPAAALQPIGKIALPKPYAREGIIVLEMDNESAAPTARCGAYVGIDTAASSPASGELFAVRLPYEGIILRRLAWDRKEKCFVLRAENPAYPEIRIQEDLMGRILGRLAWVMQKV